jgi:hypothetical protein
MDVRIEVVAAECVAFIASPKVGTIKVVSEVVTLLSVFTTSILRSLTAFGRSSISAVAPDFSFYGGAAVG